MRAFHNLEIHVAHACNLICESCSHYSNQGHKGLLSVADAEAWMRTWSPRLKPNVFTLLGGEPAANPRLAEFVRMARRYWPHSKVSLITNGFFLHRHPELPAALRDAGNYRVGISVHHAGADYQEKLKPVHTLTEQWQREYGVRVSYLPSAKYWTRRYKGIGADIQPYEDGDPRSSWDHCSARTCTQLYQNKIWKCGALAYLGLQDRKYGLSEKWKPYLAYKPLEPDCSDAELEAFFDLEEESYCGMCPAKPEKFRLPSPLPRVRVTI